MKVITRLIGMSIWWALAWFVFGVDVVGMQRIMLFLVNLGFIGALLYLFIPAIPDKPGVRMWKWLRILDIVLRVCVFVWFGWWWSAIAFGFTALVFESKKGA